MKIKFERFNSSEMSLDKTLFINKLEIYFKFFYYDGNYNHYPQAFLEECKNKILKYK